MSELGKKEFNQKDGYHRQVVCREVRLPGGYMTPGRPGRKKDGTKTPGKKKWIKVPGHISRAVLRDIGNNDWPGSKNYKGIDNIAYGTGLPERSVAKGIAVLQSVGILKRTKRGKKQTSYSHLDWALMLKMSEPFKPSKVVDSPDPSVPDDLQTLEAADDVSDLGPPATLSEKTKDAASDIVDHIMGFGPFHKIRPAVVTAIKGLLKDKSPEDIRTAWEGLEDWQKAMVVSKDNPGGYLRTMLQNAIDQKPELEPEDDDAGWDHNEEFMKNAIEQVKTTGVHHIGVENLSDETVGSFIRWACDWLDREAGDEISYQVDLDNKRIDLFAGALTR